MLFQDIAFWILAAVAIGAALGVVLIRDLFRSALLLAVVFVAVAGFFALLNAEFLAVVQVLIYVGAISILFIFAIMLSRNVTAGNQPNRLRLPAVLFPALLLAALVVTAVGTDWQPIPVEERERAALTQTRAVGSVDEDTLAAAGFTVNTEGGATQPEGLAELLIGRFVLPFEAVSLLLLAALIGGLALARSRGGQP